jgi:hypothetical protein
MDPNTPSDSSSVAKQRKKIIKTPPFTEYINSRNREDGSNSSFTYLLDIPKDNTFTKVIVTYAIIPKSYYNVASPYNIFQLTENGTTVDVKLENSTYPKESILRTALISALNAASPHHWVYNITFPSATDPQTGNFTFLVSGNAGIQPIFSFEEESLYEQIGFEPNSINTFSGNALTSTNVIYLQSERTLFIHSDITGNKNDNILQEIYVGYVQPFQSIVFQQFEYYLNAKPFVGKNNNIFMFRLTDENDKEINLNNLAWNFTIKLY